MIISIWHGGRIEDAHVRDRACPALACFELVVDHCGGWCTAWVRCRNLGACPEPVVVVDPPRWTKQPGGWTADGRPFG